MYLSMVQNNMDTDFVSTSIKSENPLLKSSATILPFVKQGKNFLISLFKINIGVVTRIKSEDVPGDNSSFNDSWDIDFDVTSKFIFQKSYKVKAKIKSVSKFSPKIILD